ncbi:LysM peptidoglycan-binding domain-containing protein [Raineya orbicola]|jgi:LysM repeat protein|uniref:LysM domain n=1 Tax=Raineya orbicola TaxID=2016530 RepID=A0A2N3I4U3_9BACT|nr:LysM peptidoglycan-binding domain-containing protein [Raineya orbicola]PKQ65312.1 LysM domain [Raineya orbicola]
MKLTSVFFLIAFSLIQTLYAIPLDSLRLEIDKNKKKAWIIHKVEAKETLFGLARRYKTTADEIIKENPQAKNLRIGDILRIPYKAFESQAVLTAPKEKNNTENKSLKHTVESKETLYSIARKYNVSVKDLQAWNKLENNEIKLGQELWVSAPTPENKEVKPQEKIEAKEKNEKLEKTEVKENKTQVQMHVVQEDESPYTIAKKYKVKLTELLEWNNLSQDSRLQIGQKLEIYPSGYKKEKLEAKVDKNPSQEVKENSENKTELNEAEMPEITRQTITISGYSKIIEKGMAVMMEDEKAGNYTGLHREAPIGTIVAIKNEANGESVFVRIVGKLPSAGNNKVLIKVSKNVFEALGAKKNAVPVEVSYIP